MQTKMVNELTTEELRKVWEVNGKLHEEVSDSMQEDAMFQVEEVLGVLKSGLSSWSIGFCNRSQHIRSSEDQRDFIDAVKAVQRDFCFMPDSYNAKVEEVEDSIEQLADTDILTEEYDDLEEQIEEAIKDMEGDLTRQFTRQLDGMLGEHEEEYFINLYADHLVDQDCYIDVETFELFEDIVYTKKYA